MRSKAKGRRVLAASPVERSRKPAPRLRKRLWIFDFDNTLAKLEPEVDWAASRQELEPVLRAAGVADELFERFPKGNLLLYDATRTWMLAERQNGRRRTATGEALRRSVSTLKSASRVIEKHELAGVERAEALEGAIELLRGLARSGAKIAIVTSNSSRTIRRWLARHRLGTVVSAIVGRDSLLGLKPSPEMVRLALRKCGARPRQAAFVGDSAADFHAARATGVSFYGIAAKPGSRDILISAGADEIFASPAALAVHLNLPGAPDGPPARDLFNDADDGGRSD